MISAITDIIGRFRSVPWGERFLLLLTVTLFLPFYLSAVVSLATVVYILAGKERRRTILRVPLFPVLAIFCVLLLVVPIVYGNYDGFGCGLLLIWYFIVALYARTFMTSGLAGRIGNAACVMSLVNVIAALVEKIFAPGLRVTGFFYNANFYAYVIEFVVIITMCLMITEPKRAPFYSIVFVLNIAALVLTDCRSAWIALLVGLLTLFALQKKGGRLIVLAVAAVVCAVLVYLCPSIIPRITNLVQASSDRMYVWVKAFNDFCRHPVFGRGLLALFQVTNDPVTPHAHNIILDALECFGLAGTALLAAFLVSAIRHAVRHFKASAGPERAVISLAAGCFATTVVHGVTDVPYIGVQTGLFLFLLLTFAGARPDNTPTDAASADAASNGKSIADDPQKK